MIRCLKDGLGYLGRPKNPNIEFMWQLMNSILFFITELKILTITKIAYHYG